MKRAAPASWAGRLHHHRAAPAPQASCGAGRPSSPPPQPRQAGGAGGGLVGCRGRWHWGHLGRGRRRRAGPPRFGRSRLHPAGGGGSTGPSAPIRAPAGKLSCPRYRCGGRGMGPGGEGGLLTAGAASSAAAGMPDNGGASSGRRLGGDGAGRQRRGGREAAAAAEGGGACAAPWAGGME